MSDQYVGEIRVFGCNFAPVGWAQCAGQLLAISQNTALFSILGTTYGGDGRSNFALPNFQGYASMHWGNGPGLSSRVLGEQGGEASVTLLNTQMPIHTHSAMGNVGATTNVTTNNVWSNPNTGSPIPSVFSNAAGTSQTMNPQAIGQAGGGNPHNNLMPYQVMMFCIALQGIFPPRS